LSVTDAVDAEQRITPADIQLIGRGIARFKRNVAERHLRTGFASILHAPLGAEQRYRPVVLPQSRLVANN